MIERGDKIKVIKRGCRQKCSLSCIIGKVCMVDDVSKDGHIYIIPINGNIGCARFKEKHLSLLEKDVPGKVQKIQNVIQKLNKKIQKLYN